MGKLICTTTDIITNTFLLYSGRFPTNGHGAGPGIPSFLNSEKGATAYLVSIKEKQHVG